MIHLALVVRHIARTVILGCEPLLMASFSAGSPKASQPIGCSTVAAHAHKACQRVAGDVVPAVPYR